MAAFAAAAALCTGVATVAEAISPPHVDNLLVTCAAAACHPRASPLMTSSCIAPYVILVHRPLHRLATTHIPSHRLAPRLDECRYAAAASAFCLSESGVAPFLLSGCA